MKIRRIILTFIFASVILFTLLTVRSTNYRLEQTFRESSGNAFYLLSFVVDHFLQYEKEVEATVIDRLRQRIQATGNDAGRMLALQDDIDISGVWVIEGTDARGGTDLADAEKEILIFHRSNLAGKNAHTLIFLRGKPFFLVNTALGTSEVLLLSRAADLYEVKIERVLDTLVTSSNLRYFAIINQENTPILFSTLYENYLPLRGDGYHKISTPEGNIFQIEESVDENRIVAGFAMDSLARIIRTNNIFLLLTVIGFVVLESLLLIGYVRFERFRFTKEREINQLKEVSAISTGFAHEFRNSVHTLSLLANDLEGENRSIILSETARMKAIMDSLRLLGTKTVMPEEIMLSELLTESAALLDHTARESAASVTIDAPTGLLTHGNRSLLVTAISNIIKNSLEAGAKKIGITATRKGREIQISCRDDGKGIDKATLDEIFDPFFSQKGQSGIGLYLTKRIIELHGGRIEVKSDAVTQFTITIPA